MISVIKSKHQTPTLHAVPNVTGTDRQFEEETDRITKNKGGFKVWDIPSSKCLNESSNLVFTMVRVSNTEATVFFASSRSAAF
jgi:hypothetical protein